MSQDIEGLQYLKWSMFDSPDQKGSGYKFMEREPVMILDDIVREHRMNIKVKLAYTSPYQSNKLALPTQSSHRIGKAVLLRITNPKSRMDMVRGLILRGVTRIGVGKDVVYFDTDSQKTRGLFWYS